MSVTSVSVWGSGRSIFPYVASESPHTQTHSVSVPAAPQSNDSHQRTLVSDTALSLFMMNPMFYSNLTARSSASTPAARDDVVQVRSDGTGQS